MTGILWAVLKEPLDLPRRFQCGQAHHVTLQHLIERDAVADLIGLPITVGILEECWNDRIQALKVVLPTWLPCQIPHPHISVSWIKEAHPVESNMMLAEEHESASTGFDHVFCMIEFEEWGEEKPPQIRQCKHCQSNRVVKIGKTPSGKSQRWRCRECNSTFST